MYLIILNSKENDRVIFEWGVGGDDKMNSSSWILNEFLKDERYNFIWRLSGTLKSLMSKQELASHPHLIMDLEIMVERNIKLDRNKLLMILSTN